MALKYIRLLIIISAILFVVVLCPVVFIAWLSANEYEPAPTEAVALSKSLPAMPVPGDPIELYSWNIGYASLDASQDFIMDGGKGVRPLTDRNVEENIWAIQAFISGSAPDIVFFQEVDTNSQRSYGVDQAGYFSGTWKGSSAFALNFSCKFVPFPVPRFIGKVESGLLTLNSYGAASAERISLPTSFTWPVRVAQLKRCLLVERLPVQGGEDGSSPELVLVNLHLEAYDSGGRAGKRRPGFYGNFLRPSMPGGITVLPAGTLIRVFPGRLNNSPFLTPKILFPGSLSPPSLEKAGSSRRTSRLPPPGCSISPMTETGNGTSFM
jgi:hypothetical protein